MTEYNPGRGFKAQDTRSTFHTKQEFAHSFSKAFWGTKDTSSPYIFVFSDKSHAESWMMARSKGGREGFALYTLDTSKLESSYVLKLSTLVEDLSIDLSLGAEQHRRDAYVCVHQISEDAVEDVESAMEIDRKSFRQSPVREDSGNHRIQQPGTHWSNDLYGYYDTDEEVEALNRNDDTINMIEGDWD